MSYIAIKEFPSFQDGMKDLFEIIPSLQGEADDNLFEVKGISFLKPLSDRSEEEVTDILENPIHGKIGIKIVGTKNDPKDEKNSEVKFYSGHVKHANPTGVMKSEEEIRTYAVTSDQRGDDEVIIGWHTRGNNKRFFVYIEDYTKEPWSALSDNPLVQKRKERKRKIEGVLLMNALKNGWREKYINAA